MEHKTTQMKMLTHPRIIKEVLTYYKNTFFALKELINNSIQAQAKIIDIKLIPSTCDKDSMQYHPIEFIQIEDDGEGIPFSHFQETFMKIATDNKKGALGVGRFGAFQIGNNLNFRTIGFDNSIKKYTTTEISLNSSDLNSERLDELDFDVNHEESETELNTGCVIIISSLHQNVSNGKVHKRQKLTEEFLDLSSFALGIFEAYPFLIFDNKIKFIINDNPIKREDYCIGEPIRKVTTVTNSRGKEIKLFVTFYNVRLKTKDISIFFQVNDSGLMKSIARYSYVSPWHTPDLGTWYITIESDFITPEMMANFELVDLGERDAKIIQDAIKESIDKFFKETNARYNSFLSNLSKDSAYPFKKEWNGEKCSLEITVFNQTAYLIELDQKLLETKNVARKTVYPLLKKVILDGNVEFLVSEVINLSDASREHFRKLLEATELDDVIAFSSSVAKHTQFLNFLYELCYGEISKWLKERKQLHKIIERNLWIFGEEYNENTLLWSDTSLEKNLYQLHTKYFSYKPTEEDENLIELARQEDKDITDLFFYNKKKLGSGREEVMIVELKAPSCAIADKEISQIERYRNDILHSSGFPKDKVTYKIILISSHITDNAKIKLKSSGTYKMEDDPFLFSHYKDEGADIKLYVMEWSELIKINKHKLAYLSTNLNVKEEDVNEKFLREYPHLLDEKSRNRLNRRQLSN